MSNFEPIAGTDLTEIAIKLLSENNIFTPFDFVNTEESKLCQVLKINSQKVVKLKSILLNLYAPKSFSLGNHFRSRYGTYRTYQTGISTLDALLAKEGDQFCTGCIWDVCCIDKVGKSKLIHTLAFNFARQINGLTLIINTSSTAYKNEVTRNMDVDGPQNITSDNAMESVKVIYTRTADELIELFNIFVNEVDEWRDLKLVVIDSLPVFWFNYKKDKEFTPSKLLMAILIKLMRKLSAEHDLSFVVGDLGSISSDEDSDSESYDDRDYLPQKCSYDLRNNIGAIGPDDASDNDTQENRSEVNIVCFEESDICNFNERTGACPMLNVNWSTVPRLRLLLQPYSENDYVVDEGEGHNSESADRLLKILKSCYTASEVSCVVHISKDGVV